MRDSGERYPVTTAKGQKTTLLRPDGIGTYQFKKAVKWSFISNTTPGASTPGSFRRHHVAAQVQPCHAPHAVECHRQAGVDAILREQRNIPCTLNRENPPCLRMIIHGSKIHLTAYSRPIATEDIEHFNDNNHKHPQHHGLPVSPLYLLSQ